jgi:phage tail-like protein
MGLIDENVPSLTTAGIAGPLSRAAGTVVTRAAGAATTAAMAVGIRSLESASGMRFDPAPAYLFFVELSGVLVALFTKCSGLEVKRDQQKVTEGGVNNYEHVLPGRVSFSNIKLERGLSLSRGLWDWMMQGRYNFKVRRINFSIVQGAPGHNLTTAIAGKAGLESGAFMTVAGQGFGKVKHWDVVDAFPVKWDMSSLDTSSGKTVIETLEIAHQGLSLSYEVLTPMSLVAGPGGL